MSPGVGIPVPPVMTQLSTLTSLTNNGPAFMPHGESTNQLAASS